MAAPYQWFDDADDFAASGRSIGGATLALVDASDFGAPGAWSTPALISARRSDATIVVVVATGRTGNTLAISGPAPGYSDAAIQAGDRIINAPTSLDMELIWAAIDAIPAGPQGPKGDKGDKGDAGAAGEAGPQGVQGPPGDAGTPGAKGDKGDTGATGATGAAGPNTVSGLIAIPNDGSIAIEGGAGTPGDPLRLRARPLVCLGRWGTATDVAGATGLMVRATSAPAACTPYKILIQAPTNPSGAGGGATVQVKVAGSDLLTAAASLAAGSTAVLAVTSGWAISSIADGAQVQPSISAIGGDVRGLLVEVWGRIA